MYYRCWRTALTGNQRLGLVWANGSSTYDVLQLPCHTLHHFPANCSSPRPARQKDLNNSPWQRGCVETFRWRTGRQLLPNGQQRAGGGSLRRSISENCRLESQRMLHTGKHHLTLSSPNVRDCFKNPWKYAQLTSQIRNTEGSICCFDYSLTVFLTTVLSKSFSWKCVQSELGGESKHKQSPTTSCKELRKFILQFLWRKKHNFRLLYNTRIKK